MDKKIVYQGEPGAFSNLACRTYHPEMKSVACVSFSEAFAHVRNDKAALAMIPVDNTVAGRVSDIYHLLPEGGLSIIAEHYLPVHHQLLVIPGTKMEDVTHVRSHPMALGQVRKRLGGWGITPVADVDTAGAARKVSERGENHVGAIASTLAGEIYGLEILKTNIEDAEHNTTRFLVLSKTPADIKAGEGPVVTSFVFKVRNVPSALFKALGGFASNGINMTKLESYMVGGSFTATQFYADVEAHPDDPNMKLAMEELAFFTEKVTLLGTYKADVARRG